MRMTTPRAAATDPQGVLMFLRGARRIEAVPFALVASSLILPAGAGWSRTGYPRD